MSQRAVVVWLLPLLVGAVAAAVAVQGGNESEAAVWEARSQALWRSKYPEEFDVGGGLAGDIKDSSTGRKNGLRAESLRWPGAVVPYLIKGPYTLEECKLLESAFDMYEQYTCVRFRLKMEFDVDFVEVTNEQGCHAELGRIGGAQILNIGEGLCLNRGTVMHELMHVLGFMHEQKRSDRDGYIKIMYENLRSGKEDNFVKQPPELITPFGVTYDFDSITHYSPLAFSKNGQPTVKLRRRTNVNIGQREYLSVGDIEKVNRMYNCTLTTIRTNPKFNKLC